MAILKIKPPPKPPGHVDGEAGFTIIEILIAMLLFIVGILGMGVLQISAIQTNTNGRLMTEAVAVAEEQMEVLMGLPYSHADLQDGDGDGIAGLTHIDAAADYTRNVGPYTIFWNVAADESIVNTTRINIIVSYNGPGSVKQVNLQNVKARDS